MNNDEIIEMARQAGMDYLKYISPESFEKVTVFAKLVAAKEHEACAKVCDELAELNRFSETDSMWEWRECAAAIRARNNV